MSRRKRYLIKVHGKEVWVACSPWYRCERWHQFFLGCGGQLTGEGGLFTSPNYPVSYPVNIQCVWRIVTKPTGSVELTFQDFHLENSGSCEFDFVEIRDGAMVDSPLIGTFCSSMIIGKIISTGNSLLVRLTSDSSVSEKGFNASWKLVSYTTSTTSMPPSSTPLSTTIRPGTSSLSRSFFDIATFFEIRPTFETQDINSYYYALFIHGKLGWRISESICLCCRFDFQTRRHVWFQCAGSWLKKGFSGFFRKTSIKHSAFTDEFQIKQETRKPRVDILSFSEQEVFY